LVDPLRLIHPTGFIPRFRVYEFDSTVSGLRVSSRGNRWQLSAQFLIVAFKRAMPVPCKAPDTGCRFVPGPICANAGWAQNAGDSI